MKWRMRIALFLIAMLIFFVGFKYWQERVVYDKIDEIIAEEGHSKGIISNIGKYNDKLDEYRKIIVYQDEPNIKYDAAVFYNPDLLQLMGMKEYDPTVYCEGYKNNKIQDKKITKHTFHHEGKQ